MKILDQHGEVKYIYKRAKIFMFVIFVSFLFILIRLGFLQLYEGDKLWERSRNNFTLPEKILPLRGKIISSDGKILASTVPQFKVSVVPVFFAKHDEYQEKVARLASLLSLSSEQEHRFINKLRKCDFHCRYTTMEVKSELSKKDIMKISSDISGTPGIIISSYYKRVYPQGYAAAHITGYVSKISKEELKSNASYLPNDFTGKTGLENEYEKVLHGKPGTVYHVIDNMGRKIEVSKNTSEYLPSNVKPLSGASIVSTIDMDLQKEAAEIFKDRSGSVVVMEVKTGRVLALYSGPSYDPNLFTGKIIPYNIWQEYSESLLKPLMNKSIKLTYFPGSTYKVIPAMAGLYYHLITPEKTYFCNGCMSFRKGKKCCWNRAGHGHVNLKRSLKESCDIYYYHLSQDLGLQRLVDFSELFNIGIQTGIDLPGEESGVLPTREWIDMNHKNNFNKGDLMNMSIGQGDLRLTPLQIALIYSTIASNGVIIKPHVVDKIIYPDGKSEEIESETVKVLDIDSSVFNEVKKGLWSVVNEPGGTAYRHVDHTIPFGAGKTGTSQVVSNYARKQIDMTQDERLVFTKDDALFAAFFPYKNPEIVAVVVLEHGGHGGTESAPIAYHMFKTYYNKHKNKKKDEKTEN